VVEMLVYAVVGGSASIFGPVVGAAFLTILPEILREVGPMVGLAPGPLRLFVNGTVLLLVILFLPNGIVSLPSRWREWRSSRRSARAAGAA
jgi:branched-chain amino acid transport system permease protein